MVRFFPEARTQPATCAASWGVRGVSIRTASRSPLISEFEVAGQVASPLPIEGIRAVIGRYGTTKTSRASGLDMAVPFQAMWMRAGETGLGEPTLARVGVLAVSGAAWAAVAGSGPDQRVDGEERDLGRRVPGLLGGGQELLAGEGLELLP